MTTQTTTQSDPKYAVASPRKGRKSGVVSELSVFLKVKRGHEKQIREVFASAAADRPAQDQQKLEAVGTLHEAGQVLFDDDTRLLIATSFDGDWDAYIDDFARTGSSRTGEPSSSTARVTLTRRAWPPSPLTSKRSSLPRTRSRRPRMTGRTRTSQ